jgi:glutaredoxin 3
MPKIVIYTSASCSYCVYAKKLLDSKGYTYTEIRVDIDSEKREEMMRLSGRRTVPQIFIDDESIGGYDDLKKLELDGELEKYAKK